MRYIIFPALLFVLMIPNFASAQKFRHISSTHVEKNITDYFDEERLKAFQKFCTIQDSIREAERFIARLDSNIRHDSVVAGHYKRFPSPLGAPLIFTGYRTVTIPGKNNPWMSNRQLMKLYGPVSQDLLVNDSIASTFGINELREFDDIKPLESEITIPLEELPSDSINMAGNYTTDIPSINIDTIYQMPEWLTTSLRSERIYGDAIYLFMIENPEYIDYAVWDLPIPPRLPEEDKSFYGYLKTLTLPKIDPTKAILPEFEQERRYWLHYFNIGLQFSQAYISSNWYQGGNNYLALLFNFTWNVDLNTVYKPNLLLQSSLEYKLGINSNPKEAFHKYSISQDIFQYNLKAGFKAFKRWFYSINLQLKTPIFNAYPEDSKVRSAALFSPGTLNLGLGMTYNYENEKKTFKFSASISPLSYNLKTCMADDVDHEQYGIRPWRHTNSEIGSNAEANLIWNISDNILWTSRIFLFSDYKYFLADWQNTILFNINKFLSTQIYLHPRFDSSSDFNSSKWHYWMFKEILSFGLTYTFSSKP